MQYPITVSGNTRTEPAFIENLTLDCLRNQDIQQPQLVDRKALRECILNSKLFSDVSISTSHDGVLVTVDERWTLIPIPVIHMESGGDPSYGLFLLERNFLGKGKTAAFGGIISDEKKMMFVMYEDKSIFFSNWKFKINFGVNKDQFSLMDGQDEIDGLDSEVTFFISGLGYSFTPAVSGYLLVRHNKYRYDQLENYRRPVDFTDSSIGIDLKLDLSTFRFYYQEGLNGRLKLFNQIERSDGADKDATVEMKIDWQKRVFDNQALQIGMIAALTENVDERTALRIGSRPGTRGIPEKGAWAEAYAALSLDYQIPLLSRSEGTWTVAPFLDTGSIRMGTADHRNVHYSACGIGTYFFLKEIAIPGIGLIFGINDTYQESFYKGTIGFDF